MDSTTYLHDGSFEGLLTAVARAVKSQKAMQGIYTASRYIPKLFDTPIQVSTDSDQAHRLFQYLQKVKGRAATFAMNGFLSEDPEVGTHLYQMVLQCLRLGSKATQLSTNDSIRYLETLSQRVRSETHRFTGLIRFRILEDDLQYAPFEPDHMIIGYLALHFQKRLHSRQWILHDVRRGYGLYWDCKSLQPIDIDEDFTAHVRRHGEIPDNRLNKAERHYQQLWKSFHSTIAISDKKNSALQRQFMPRRYWKYLVEMK